MKLSLLILAAGMGSRYGGLKQLDQLGPGGETVMDYSIFDAIRAGFERVVFVIRHDFEEEFRRTVGSRYEHRIEVEYAYQRLDDLPADFTVPEGRVKPWGTGHAVYAARELLDGPFAAINADDFYGEASYRELAESLRRPVPADGRIHGCIAAFVLAKTLSENGSVSRGICSDDGHGHLAQVVEHTRIVRRDGGIISLNEDGSETELPADAPASMNCWGFQPQFTGELERLFTEFLAARGRELKSEFYLPAAVDTLIRAGRAEIDLLRTASNWFGITYREDRAGFQAALAELTDSGAYPKQLFR